RGFELRFARQGDDALKTIAIEDADAEPFSDSRISPVRRLVKRLIDACENGGSPTPRVAGGYPLQCLIRAAPRAHATRPWSDVAPPPGHPPNLVGAGLSKP